MGAKVNLYWGDSSLLIDPWQPFLAKVLSFSYKTMAMDDNFKLASQRQNVDIFKTEITDSGSTAGRTFQGMWRMAQQALEQRGFEVVLQDRRLPFPKPEYDKMHGFRFSQESLLRSALEMDRSGTIGAPTRFGKTTLLINTLRAFPDLTTIVTAPGVDLLSQLVDEIKRQIPGREVRGLFTGSKTRSPCEDINVVSFDSLEKVPPETVRLMLIDEPHAAVSQKRAVSLNKFDNARKIGFGATLNGRFDGSDILITGLIGPVLAERTYLEAVAEGAICPLHVVFCELPVKNEYRYSRDAAYREFVWENDYLRRYINWICQECISQDLQTILFIKQQRQAEFLKEKMPEAVVAMAEKLSGSARRKVFEQMKANEVKRCIASEIYSTGVTFSELRVVINAYGGGGSISCIQKPGRLAEIRPGKSCGVVIDFWPRLHDGATPQPGVFHISNDAKYRRQAYVSKGYNIHDVRRPEELKAILQVLLAPTS